MKLASDVAKDMQGKRVFVGLSGGVDSGVTAALLKDAGAIVTGVFIKGWYPPDMPCSWAEDRRDAMRVAAHLRIPFLTLDASKEYKEAVIDYLIREYRAGRTPNPDIMCNREVKFGAFHAFAMREDADYIATGHYAQVRREEGATTLVRGIDEGKDQSYFLWAVPQAALSHTLFPLGGMHKADVRKLARTFNMPNALKRDSQGICFLGSISVDDFLRAEMKPTSGKALGETGKEVGTHDGAVLYTLGERIALRDSTPGPWYVVRKDMEANTVTVSGVRDTPDERAKLPLIDTNWFRGIAPSGRVLAQYRYHGPRVAGTFAPPSFTPETPLPEPVAAGQSLVLFDGDTCLGGGIIE
ncbi:MAG TPA: tRNA 2-thiouridine(34) synthase MnmA [Candidatus Paceibacterota bacterium]|jgi:tRNA-specific 2-thiouridylase